MCPGNNESAGKRYSGKTRKGSPWLRRALVEAAHGAGRTKHTYFQALYGCLAVRGANNGRSSPSGTACWSPVTT